MADPTVTEEWITASDGAELFTMQWKPARESPVATVVFCHGFGEHVKRYCHVFDKFAKAGIEVYGYDLRGFGQTGEKSKRLGVTGGMAVTCSDITDALRKQRREGVPQFLMGHSMGGGIVAHYATVGEERSNLAGIILSAPFIDQPPKIKPSELKVYACTALSKIMPSFQMKVVIDEKGISHDPQEVDKYVADPLIHGIGSLGGLADLIWSVRKVQRQTYKEITLPVLIAHGNKDPITCFKTAKQLFDKIPSTDKTFREWDGLYHELHNEYEKDRVIEEYIDWILKHTGGKK
ncbi:5828_t:CDS:2 [Paraglomus occultum]|uniref:5828_t:CDS:1 n=1 Tax=Paraglomus occultum TaxID=144539 RepID=A0A9N9C8Q8_9GLOM|nr:5828_t:CDS:2 [Paraglomus occultum]